MKEKIIKKIDKEIKKSLKNNDIPIGCVIVLNNKIISLGHNNREKKQNILGHAEINAILKACKKLKRWHLNDCELYVNLEPCEMCKNIIKQTRIKKVYYFVKNNNSINLDKTTVFHYLDENSDYNNLKKKEITNFFKKIRTSKSLTSKDKVL